MKTIIILQIFLVAILFGQNKILKPIGYSGPANEIKKNNKMVNSDNGFAEVKTYDRTLNGLDVIIDTLRYADRGSYDIDYGFFGQDIMVQWFEAPKDMLIKGVSFFVPMMSGPMDQ